MDDFQRRLLDTAQTSVYLAEFTKANANVLGLESFTYNSSAAIRNLATTASAQDIIQIQSDSDFLMFAMAGSGNIHGTGLTAQPNAIIQFTDTGTGKTYYSQPALFGNVLGAAGYPFLLPIPRIIPPNTNIKIDVTNNDPQTVDFYVSLIGVRVYYKN